MRTLRTNWRCLLLVSLSICSEIAAGEQPIGKSKAFRADERIDVLVPTTAALATPVEIPLQVEAPGLVNVSVEQVETMRYGVHRSVEGSVMSLLIQYHGGAAYVTVVPRRLGILKLNFFCGYSDCGFAVKHGSVQVGPPHQPAARIIVAQAGDAAQSTPRILLGLSGFGSQNSLNVYAVFNGIDSPLSIDASYARFRVISADAILSVEVDEQTGGLRPVHIGETLVETSFAGRKVLTCVAVEGKMDGGQAYPHANCQKLLTAGGGLGQSVEQ